MDVVDPNQHAHDVVKEIIFHKYKLKLEQQSMVHHRKYPLFFTYNLYLGVKVTQHAAQYLLHNVTYATVKFEGDMSTG